MRRICGTTNTGCHKKWSIIKTRYRDLNHFEEIEDIVDKKIKVRKEKEDK